SVMSCVVTACARALLVAFPFTSTPPPRPAPLSFPTRRSSDLDSGLVCYLTRWSSAETLEYGAMNGAILENYVVSEIAKTYLNCGKEPYLYYYRDKDAREIDIVLEHDGVLNPIEIKKTAAPGTELTRVFSLLDKASVPRGAGAIVCMKPQLSALDRENFIVPVWMI